MIESIAATEDASALRVNWDNGAVSTLSAADLRREARDAVSIRERLDHDEVRVMPGITITGLQQVGAQGVNVQFSDGHDRAIYPFAYLRELSERFDN